MSSRQGLEPRSPECWPVSDELRLFEIVVSRAAQTGRFLQRRRSKSWAFKGAHNTSLAVDLAGELSSAASFRCRDLNGYEAAYCRFDLRYFPAPLCIPMPSPLRRNRPRPFHIRAGAVPVAIPPDTESRQSPVNCFEPGRIPSLKWLWSAATRRQCAATKACPRSRT